MKYFLKKYQLILFLSFVAISLFFIKINNSYKNVEVKTQTQIPTTITPTSIIKKEENETEVIKESSESAKIKTLIPYVNKDFVIESFDSIKTFKVKTLTSDKVVVAQGMLKWFQENKLKATDYQVVFID